MKRLFNYLHESYNEIKLVTWPKQEDLIRLTIITVVFVLITAVILGLIDFGFTRGFQYLLSLRS